MSFKTNPYDQAKIKAASLGEELLPRIQQYINHHYIEEIQTKSLEAYDLEDFYVQESVAPPEAEIQSAKAFSKQKRSLEDVVSQIEETFSQRLLGLIDEKGMTDVEAYKAADVDRRLFSKIRSNEDYTPSKNKAVSFVIGLQLNMDEASDLLARAGYALSPSSKFDLIIRFFIEEEIYDLFEINQALDEFGEKLLGA